MDTDCRETPPFNSTVCVEEAELHAFRRWWIFSGKAIELVRLHADRTSKISGVPIDIACTLYVMHIYIYMHRYCSLC